MTAASAPALDRPVDEGMPEGTRGDGTPAAAVWRAVRLPVAVVLLVAVGAVVLGVLAGRYPSGRLDPRSVDPAGSRALAVLLADRGVTVHRVHGLAPVLAGAGPASTVFLPFPDQQPKALLARLPDLPPSVRLVLLAPAGGQLDQVSAEVSLTGGSPVQRRDPGCGDPTASTAGDADVGGGRYTLAAPADGATCYDGSLVTARSRTGQPVAVAGAPDAFTNDRLAQRGNAALTVGLLDDAPELWWVLPDIGAGAPTGQRQSLLALLPGWVGPVTVELALAALLVALWRGRRLGPVISEALPVVVRAAESVEGRARLYRRARARDRAADALRGAARARLVGYLGLGRATPQGTAPAALVAAVSEHCGRPAVEMGELLFGGPPADDPALVRLAGALDQIVRSTLDTGVLP